MSANQPQKPVIGDDGELVQNDPTANPRNYAYFVEAMQIEIGSSRRFSLLDVWWAIVIILGIAALTIVFCIGPLVNALSYVEEIPLTPVTPYAVRYTVTPRAVIQSTATFKPIVRAYFTTYPLTLTQQAVYSSPTPF